MQSENEVKIIETSNFIAKAERFLSQEEIGGIRLILAKSPLQGRESAEVAGLFRLEWGKSAPIFIVYLVADDLNQIFLLDIQNSSLVELSNTDKLSIMTILKRLTAFGVAYGAKELAKKILEQVKEHWDDWFGS